MNYDHPAVEEIRKEYPPFSPGFSTWHVIRSLLIAWLWHGEEVRWGWSYRTVRGSLNLMAITYIPAGPVEWINDYYNWMNPSNTMQSLLMSFSTKIVEHKGPQYGKYAHSHAAIRGMNAWLRYTEIDNKVFIDNHGVYGKKLALVSSSPIGVAIQSHWRSNTVHLKNHV